MGLLVGHSIRTILQGATGIDQMDAEILLAHVLGTPREYLFAHPEVAAPFWKRRRFFRAIKKRANGAPVAYLTGHKEFYGLDFLVNRHTLVPRPETETLVQSVLDEIQNAECRMQNVILIDVGTGTGCVPIAIMKSTKQEIKKAYATDISRRALRVAKKNAQKHGMNITFLHGDLLSPIIKSKICNLKSKIIVTANLPYLTAEQFKEEPSIQHEPRSALVAGDGGLALYKKLLGQVNAIARQSPNASLSMFFEIDPSQSAPLSYYVRTLFPSAAITMYNDLHGNERIIMISFSRWPSASATERSKNLEASWSDPKDTSHPSGAIMARERQRVPNSLSEV